MKFHVISVFPELVQQTLQWGVVGRALEKSLFSVHLVNPRTFTTNVHKTIDDTPFGGGDGMLMLFDPLAQAVESIPGFAGKTKVFMSPTGRLLNEALVQELAAKEEIIILSGRYGGVDQRLLHHYQFMSVSVGDYVVSGGELPAGILMDAIVRKIPGVLGNAESSQSDSFACGGLFEAPAFTKPRENRGGKVPDVLLEGDHKKIEEFRTMVGLALTLQWRPDLVPPMAEKDLKKLHQYLLGLQREDCDLLGLDMRVIEGRIRG